MATMRHLSANAERWERLLAEHAGLPLGRVVMGGVKAHAASDRDTVRVTFEIAHDMSYEDFNRILAAAQRV